MSILNHHNGGPPSGYTVTQNGVKVADANPNRRYWLGVNTDANNNVWLALSPSTDGTTPSAVVDNGIFVKSNGGSYEIGTLNMYTGEIWAITAVGQTARLSVQTG